MLELIAAINREGVTVFMVEQNASLALSIASRAYVLRPAASFSRAPRAPWHTIRASATPISAEARTRSPRSPPNRNLELSDRIMTTQGKRLGFFTRLLDRGSAAGRYRLATEQIVEAERCGFDTAWVAQHHFHEDEGGLPSPFVFLAQVATQTSRIRLGTGVVTLPIE